MEWSRTAGLHRMVVASRSKSWIARPTNRRKRDKLLDLVPLCFWFSALA